MIRYDCALKILQIDVNHGSARRSLPGVARLSEELLPLPTEPLLQELGLIRHCKSVQNVRQSVGNDCEIVTTN